MVSMVCADTALAVAEPPGEVLPVYDAAAPEEPRITEAALLDAERFWPYRVALTSAWRSEAAATTLREGTVGVLIRAQQGGLARVDFGRHGLYELPVARTDLVERANQVRRGERRKMAPNFVLALGPRLLEPGPSHPRSVRMSQVFEERWFLTVFSGPREERLRELAEGLRSLASVPGLMTILLPQGELPDPEMARRLREVDWPISFVMDHLSESYMRTLLREDFELPSVMLQTAEGRVLLESPWREGLAGAVRDALETADPASTQEVARP